LHAGETGFVAFPSADVHRNAPQITLENEGVKAPDASMYTNLVDPVVDPIDLNIKHFLSFTLLGSDGSAINSGRDDSKKFPLSLKKELCQKLSKVERRSGRLLMKGKHCKRIKSRRPPAPPAPPSPSPPTQMFDCSECHKSFQYKYDQYFISVINYNCLFVKI